MRLAAGLFIAVFFISGLALGQENIVETGTTVIEARVNGLVCDFCARALEKVFSKQPQVQNMKVDLTAKILTLELKPGESLDDQSIKDLVKKAGYTVEEITRKIKEK